MGTFSPTHWFIFLVMITPLMALLVVPTWRILQRADFNDAWALLIFGGLFALYPSDREASAANRLLDSAGEWLSGQASGA